MVTIPDPVHRVLAGTAIEMGKQSIIFEFWEFLKFRKRYWLLPIVIMLGLLGSLIIFSQSSVLAPFIYALF